MPFPWKKVKNTKISQLVSDHLESQRRQRGHLVVETGFPTSLVDLFVKHRDRLKKPKSSKKKKKKTQNIDNSSLLPSASPFRLPQEPSHSFWTSPSISPTPSSSSLALTAAASLSSSTFSNGVEEADGVDVEINECPNAKGVIGAILRIFFVVILALGSKKFAVGLTTSAFLLFLLEYVGKHSYRLFVPCSEAERRLRLMMQRILQIISFRDKNLDEDNSTITGIKGQLEASSEFNNHGSSSPICEIQSPPPMFMEDIQGVRKEVGESSSDRRRDFQFEMGIGQPCDGNSQLERSDAEVMVFEKEVEYGCNVSVSKKGNFKRAGMKLKMKSLVPKKLRRSKKEKLDFGGETSPKKEKIVAIAEESEENEQGYVRILRCDRKLCFSVGRRHDVGNDQINTICSSGVVGDENVEEIVIRDEQEKQRKGNSGYLILCLVVLIGLVGGRIIAFMLMVLWFLMLKSGEKLKRYIKLPVIRSPSEQSG